MARPVGGGRPGGVITAGGVTILLTATRPLTAVHIVRVGAGGSFAVLAEEQPANAVISDIILPRYGDDSCLLRWARVPLAGPYTRPARRLAVGPDGAVYVLTGRGRANAFVVRQLNFYPPTAPLPPKAPSSSTTSRP